MKRKLLMAVAVMMAVAAMAENWLYAPVPPTGPFEWQPVTEDGGFWVCCNRHKDLNQPGRPDGVYNFSGGEWEFDEMGRLIFSLWSNKPDITCRYDDQNRIIYNNVLKSVEFPGDPYIYKYKELNIKEFDSEITTFPIKWTYKIEMNRVSAFIAPEILEGTIEVNVIRDDEGRVTEVGWPDQTLKYTYGEDDTAVGIEITGNEDGTPILKLSNVKWQTTDNQLLARCDLYGDLSEVKWEEMPFLYGNNIISSAVIDNYKNEAINFNLSRSYTDESVQFVSVRRGGDLYDDLVIYSGDKTEYHYRHWIDMYHAGEETKASEQGIPDMYSQEAIIVERDNKVKSGIYRVRTDYSLILKEDNIGYMAEPSDFNLADELKNGMTFDLFTDQYTGYPLKEVSHEKIKQSTDEEKEIEVPLWIEYFEDYLAFGNAKGLGVESVSINDVNVPERWYRLDGTQVHTEQLAPGFYIHIKGNKTEKILVK